MKVELAWDEFQWRISSGIAGASHLQLVQLKVALDELSKRVGDAVDTDTAEGQLKAEIGRRMGNLMRSAQAAGGVSDMWNNQNSRFYKERLAIEGLRHERVES